MPILETQFDPQAPLAQGDILKGVPLFVTLWESLSPESSVSKGDTLCLIISRPCITAHKSQVVAALIERYHTPNYPASFETLEEARLFFSEIRDGHVSPDQFYLGQLDGFDGWCCARMDSLHTVKIPPVEDMDGAEMAGGKERRNEFVKTHRVARLLPDFSRDLHLRIFRAFASLGFDDHQWFSNNDLKMICGVAALEESKAKIAMENSRLELEKALRGDKPPNEKHKLQLENTVKNKESELMKIQKESAKYRAELHRRRLEN